MNRYRNHRSMRKVWRLATLLATVFGTALIGFSPGAFAATGASVCSTNPPNRALDFWVGDWTIAAPGGGAQAKSSVTLELGKCLVVERWDGGRGHAGENFFGYSADDKSWHGLFADNEGRVHVFLDGNVTSGSAVFTGPSRDPEGKTVLNRVTIRGLNNSRVEQLWEKSFDEGKTWTIAFRGEYTRKQP